MTRRTIDVNITGLNELITELNGMVDATAIADVDGITEAYARKMAEESAALAPIDLGGLKGSIASSPQEADDDVHVWEWGSNLPYATRMEYEHPTRKGFVRKAVWDNRAKYRDAIKRRLRRS